MDRRLGSMGEAGFGAEEQASRRARRVAQLRAEQDRATELDAGVHAALARAQRDQRAWSAGAEGERLVAASISSVARYGWTALHDLHWPGRPKANLDHVAIGPGGIVLIDAKNWSGDVSVADGRLRQNGFDRTSQVESVAAAAADLAAELAPQHRSAVRGVICLASQDVLPTESAFGVIVVGRPHLPALLASFPLRLSPFDVADVGRFLEVHLGGDTSPGVPAAKKRIRATKPRRDVGSVPKQRQQGGRRRPRTSPGRSPRVSCVGAVVRLGVVCVGLIVLLNVLSKAGGQ